MQVLRHFKADQGGATAMLFGLALVPLVGAVGSAVDYSRAASFHSRAQLAVDQAALAIVKEPKTATTADIQTKGERYVSDALGAFLDPKRGITLGSVSATRVGNTVKVTVAGTLKSSIMQVVGIPTIPVSAESQAAWGSGVEKIELALVLDNTGSMDQTIGGKRKMDELKTAAKDLLKDLRNKLATDTDSVKVSVVPFDTEVRLDAAANRFKPWFRWANEARDRPAWTGYVFDRYGSYATSDAAPTTGDSLYPAPRDSEYRTDPRMPSSMRSDLAAMRPLTSLNPYSGYSDLVSVVDGMQPRGFTNVGLGVTWGMATLSQSEPFTDAAAPGTKGVKKYMIVLTDGDNTASHVDGALYNADWESNLSKRAAMVANIDATTLGACSMVKRAGVEVFTIKLIQGSESLLRSCASPEDKGPRYFDVQKSGDLAKVFDIIMTAISGTRLTH